MKVSEEQGEDKISRRRPLDAGDGVSSDPADVLVGVVASGGLHRRQGEAGRGAGPAQTFCRPQPDSRILVGEVAHINAEDGSRERSPRADDLQGEQGLAGHRVQRDGSGGVEVGARVTLDQLEAEHIRRILAATPTVEEAAAVLGIDPSTLYRKRKRYGL